MLKLSTIKIIDSRKPNVTKVGFAIVLLMTSVCTALGATYFVAKNGSNTNPGTQASPFLTISFAAGKVAPGDTVRVQAGMYDEVPEVRKSGANGAMINFVADGQVIIRGFFFTSANYIRLIGFEITHPSKTFNDAIGINGSSSHIELIDLNIHDVHATHGGIVSYAGSVPVPTYITIRGCSVTGVGIPPNSTPDSPSVGISTAFNTSHHWLIEYNTMARVGDFINAYGQYIIIRNNYLHDFRNNYWNTTDSFHADMFQPGSDGVKVTTQNHVYEGNYCSDSIELNSHFGIWQDTIQAGDHNILIRGNVAYNLGSAFMGVISTDHVWGYNNTVCKTVQRLSSGNASVQFYKLNSGPSSTDLPLNCGFKNNLIWDAGLCKFPLQAANGATADFAFNWGFQAGSSSSYIGTLDPSLVDLGNKNFRLLAVSPLRGAGTPLVTVASPDGSGTSFDVNDGDLLCDGFGIAEGDTVTIGSTTTRISNITSNTVTVVDSVTWTAGQAVFWGSAPTVDIGAFPFGASELTKATISASGNDYTVTLNGDARGVWFYVDGIPTTWVSSPPYTATFANGVVTAKAYAMYPQTSPIIECKKKAGPPTNVRVGGNNP